MKINSNILQKLIREEYQKLLLTEDSIYNIYEKYYKNKFLDKNIIKSYNPILQDVDKTLKSVFEKIISIDPFTKLPNKMGKYSKWLLKYAKTITDVNDLNRFIGEDRVRITDYLKKYERLVMSGKLPQELRQIDKFESPHELYTKVIEPYFKVEGDDTKEIEKKLLKNDDAEIVFNGSEWQIIVPKTEQSACIFGSNTEWCTAWGQFSTNPSYRDRENYFSNGKRYGQDFENDPLYIIINKSNPKEKYQFHFGSNQFKDSADNNVKPLEFLEKNPELKKYFIKNEYDILRFFGVRNYKINSEGLIDVEGNVYLSYMKLKQIPFKFGHVSGYFICSNNKLQTLNGAPQTVGGSFNCSFNELQTLDGSPQTVGGYFYCSQNELQTLQGSPETVGGDFICSRNKLKTLQGAPQTVGGYFNCSNNKLQTLHGAPETVGGNFACSNNELTSLEGSPETIGGDFYCSNNKLQTLNGSPQTVGGNFYCSRNKLQTLQGSPKTVGGDFSLYDNVGKRFTEKEIRSVCDVKGTVYV